MPIKINDGFMRLQTADQGIATGRQRPDRWWQASGRSRLFESNQAIVALTVIEPLAAGCDRGSPFVASLRGELR